MDRVDNFFSALGVGFAFYVLAALAIAVVDGANHDIRVYLFMTLVIATVYWCNRLEYRLGWTFLEAQAFLLVGASFVWNFSNRVSSWGTTPEFSRSLTGFGEALLLMYVVAFVSLIPAYVIVMCLGSRGQENKS